MRKWLPLVAVCLGSFMLLIDVTIVNVALPDMALDLHTSFASLQWVVDAYALALAAVLLGVGALADLTGHRRTYLTGLAAFALASVLCGAAQNTGWLITVRTVQGLGAAAMFATAFPLLNSSYHGRDRATAYGVWGAVSGAAASVGPVLGGLLTEVADWRWIFYVNVPVSVVAIALSVRVLAGERPQHERRPDYVGTALFTLAAAALVYALIRANELGWTSGAVLGLFAVAAVALAGFLAVQARSRHAMLDLSLFRKRSFNGVMIAALLINFAAFAMLTYASIWLQSLLGLSPLQAGLTGLPMSLAVFASSLLVGRLLHGVRPQLLIGIGMLLVGLGSLTESALIHAGSGWAALIPGYLVIGIGAGAMMPILGSSATAAVGRQRAGMAAGAVNTARQLGYAVGIAVLGSVFSSQASGWLSSHAVSGAHSLASALSSGRAAEVLATTPAAQHADLVTALHGASAHALQASFAVAGAAGIVAGLLALVLMRPQRRGNEQDQAGSAARTSPQHSGTVTATSPAAR
ncbi:MFS transporter [Streptomyces sp. NBC_00005]|uniref:MFS transporter n=1 Tax=Streptomyces sp. NBC_00005 TaxID=2903609 RepID=UPI00324EACA3